MLLFLQLRFAMAIIVVHFNIDFLMLLFICSQCVLKASVLVFLFQYSFIEVALSELHFISFLYILVIFMTSYYLFSFV